MAVKSTSRRNALGLVLAFLITFILWGVTVGGWIAAFGMAVVATAIVSCVELVASK